MITDGGYGFRARGLKPAPRNDEIVCREVITAPHPSNTYPLIFAAVAAAAARSASEPA